MGCLGAPIPPVSGLRTLPFPLAFSILAARAVASFIRKKHPSEDEEEYEPEPAVKTQEEPKSTGNPELDLVLKEGKLALSELGRLYAAINKPDVKQRVLKIIDITDKIVRDAERDQTYTAD